MHPRLSVHQICFAGLPLSEYIAQCQALGARQLGLISPALLAPGGMAEAQKALAATNLKVQSIAHVFHGGHLSNDRSSWETDRTNLTRLIDCAAELGAQSIYMLTGGHGSLRWKEAADCFCEAIRPCAERAKASGIKLAIENASSLYADIHIAHSLADTIRLAEMADIGVCIELFFCWAEADLATLFKRAMPRCHLVQVSDYIYGDRSLPARAVPGDGVIPLRQLLTDLLQAGYTGAFDIELLGPRIEQQGAVYAVQQAAIHTGELLQQIERAERTDNGVR